MMMRRYVLMYVGWIAGVFTMAAIAVAWYRHVEQIGVRALADKLRTRQAATDATEDTDLGSRAAFDTHPEPYVEYGED